MRDVLRLPHTAAAHACLMRGVCLFIVARGRERFESLVSQASHVISRFDVPHVLSSPQGPTQNEFTHADVLAEFAQGGASSRPACKYM